MNNRNLQLPANCAILNQEEMTYTTGGADAGSVAALISGGISLAVSGLLLYNWIDQLLGARRWYAANKTGNIGTDLEKGVDTWLNYTTTSVLNCVRSVLATAASIGSPLGWVVSAVAFATV